MNHFSDKIVLIGVGSSGCRLTISYAQNHPCLNYLLVDMDVRYLQWINREPQTIFLDEEKYGRGPGKKDGIGKILAEQQKNRIAEELSDACGVILISGLGGTTGSEVLPYLAELIRREIRIFCVAVVSLPCLFEGERKVKKAEQALRMIRNCCDVSIILSIDEWEQQEPLKERLHLIDLKMGAIIDTVYRCLF